MGVIAEEAQAAGLVGGDELLQEQPPEQAREHAHGQEEARPAGHPALAVGRDAAARHDHVHVRVMGHRRAPGVQHGGDADAGAEMLRIGGDRQHGLGRDLEQEIVDHGLVLVGDVGDRRRQREHHVIVRHRQQLGLALGEPFLRGGALALRAVPVAAGVVGDGRIGAVLAARDMAAEGRRAAALDRRHHLQLVEADMAGIGLTPCRAMVAEDIRNLQSRARHARRASAGRPDLLELERDVLQRAHDLADRLGGDAGIERRGVELGVTEQHLDHADIDVLLEQVGGEAVPQGVQRDALVDLRHLGGGVTGAIELARGHRLGRIAAREQPALRAAPPSTRRAADRAGAARA